MAENAYKIVVATSEVLLINEVNGHVLSGYTPIGGVSVIWVGANKTLYQAVYKSPQLDSPKKEQNKSTKTANKTI